MNYIEDVAKILSEMKFSIEQMHEQTNEALDTMRTLEIPDLKMGYVTLESIKHPVSGLILAVVEDGNRIGFVGFYRDYGNRTVNVEARILGKRVMSRMVEEDDILDAVIEVLGKFHLVLAG